MGCLPVLQERNRGVLFLRSLSLPACTRSVFPCLLQSCLGRQYNHVTYTFLWRWVPAKCMRLTGRLFTASQCRRRPLCKESRKRAETPASDHTHLHVVVDVVAAPLTLHVQQRHYSLWSCRHYQAESIFYVLPQPISTDTGDVPDWPIWG